MAWRDRLRRASFRGVPFRVDETSDAVGRWTQRHDFVRRAKPFVEDLGVRAREFRIRAYVLGLDYLEQLDLLLEALEAEGPGELVHPTLGTYTVSLVEQARVQQTQRDGGFASIELSFVESEAALAPSVATVPGPELEALADSAADSAAAAFSGRVDVDLVPELAREAITAAVLPTTSFLSKLDLPAATQALADWRRRISAVQAPGGGLLRNPSAFALELRSILADVEDLAGGRLPGLDVYRQLLALPRSVFPGRGTTSILAARNGRATDDLSRFLAFAGASRAAARAPWSSLDEALRTRASLLEASEVLEDGADQRDLKLLLDLRAKLAAAVPPEERGLPREREVLPRKTVASLALAYQIDGDVDGELDLVERNRPRHPGFLPGGRALEVLDLA